MVSSAQVKAIVAATECRGASLIREPEQLAKCLSICLDWYEEAEKYTSSRRQNRERAELARLKTAADSLRSQLNSQSISLYSSFIPHLAKLDRMLKHLSEGLNVGLAIQSTSEAESGFEQNLIDTLGYRDHFKARSPLEWLVGFYLSEAFDLTFDVVLPKRKRAYGAFVLAVIRELKIKNGRRSFAPESIRKARRVTERRKSAVPVDRSIYEFNRIQSLAWACGTKHR